MAKEPEYGNSENVTTSFPEAVRKRPLMYVGDVDEKGVYYALFSIFRNLFSGLSPERVTWKSLSPTSGRISFYLSGSLVPEDLAEQVKRDDWRIADSFWNIPVLNCLSKSFQLCLEPIDGEQVKFDYLEGKNVGAKATDREIPVKRISFEFDLDLSIFDLSKGISPQIVLRVLTEYSHLLPECPFEFEYQNEGKDCNVLLKSQGGLSEMLDEHLTVEYHGLNRDFRFALNVSLEGYQADVAGRFGPYAVDPPYSRSWANFERTIEDGGHVDAVVKGVTFGFMKFFQKHELVDTHRISEDAVRDGLQLFVHLRDPEATFLGCIRNKIEFKERYSFLSKEVEQNVFDLLDKDVEKSKLLLRKFSIV